MGRRHLLITGRTGLGGARSPAQGVFGVSCQAKGGPSSSENRAHRPGGDGESCPGGVRSLLPGQWGAIFCREPGAPARGGRGVLPRGCSEPPARPMGGHLLQRTGRTGPGGTGSPAQEVFGVPCQAKGGPSSSENRAHRPRGDGESCQGGVRSLLPGQWGAIFFREPGAPARGGRGALPRGCSESPPRPRGGHHLQRTGRTGQGDGEPCPGGVRSLLPGQGGAIFLREPGTPARGGRGVLPRGCLESPARPMGGHLLQRTGRTGPGGTGSPAQGVFGVSCQANGGPSSSENRAHRPGGDGESCPGGVRSLLPGQWGAIFFREPGEPARGGRGVLPRGCSESPARPRGGHLLQRTGRNGPGGTGSPAQGVFGVSCQANGGQCTASLPGGSGQWNSCNALPHCPGAVGSGTPAMHGLTALGQWTVQLLQCTASLPGGSGLCNSCNALPHCLGAVGSATPATHRLTAWGQWAAQLLQCTTSLPGGSGQWNSCNALPHCPGAVGSGTLAMHCPTTWGQWAVQLLQCTASLPGGSGQWNSRNALPHCLGAVDSAASAMHCLTALGVVWCGVVWCGVVWCGVPKAL